MASQPDKAIVIGISGPSSSGKTTLARLLQTVFSGLEPKSLNTFIIHEDDFFLPDDQIPYTTTPSGKTLQDWDTVNAMDIPFLSSALSYVRKNGSLPPRLKSKEDLNEAFDSGVDGETIAQLRADVGNRLLEKQQQRTAPSTLAFLEGFLLYSPPEAEVEEHVLRSVHRNIDVHLFLPAPYDIVKARRESRSGYVTTGPQPPVPTGAEAAVSSESKEVDLEAEDDRPPQNFWTDPPGYVDDIVWPRYVQDHSWLLLPEADSQDDDLVKRMGQGVNVRSDAGVIVAPGQGSKPAADILKWAVEEIMKYLLAE